MRTTACQCAEMRCAILPACVYDSVRAAEATLMCAVTLAHPVGCNAVLSLLCTLCGTVYFRQLLWPARQRGATTGSAVLYAVQCTALCAVPTPAVACWQRGQNKPWEALRVCTAVICSGVQRTAMLCLTSSSQAVMVCTRCSKTHCSSVLSSPMLSGVCIAERLLPLVGRGDTTSHAKH